MRVVVLRVLLAAERKPTADQQLTVQLDTLLSALDQLQTRLTAVQQQALPTHVSHANDLLNSYEVLLQEFTSKTFYF